MEHALQLVTVMNAKGQNGICNAEIHVLLHCLGMKMSLIIQQLWQFNRQVYCTHLRMDLGSIGELIPLVTAFLYRTRGLPLSPISSHSLANHEDELLSERKKGQENSSAGSGEMVNLAIATRIIFFPNQNYTYFDNFIKIKFYKIFESTKYG